MSTSEIERAAYLAAHRIVVANTTAPELACPGARRSYVIDTIANIIKEVFELGDSSFAQDLAQDLDWAGCGIESEPAPLEPRRTSALFELPRRASS